MHRRGIKRPILLHADARMTAIKYIKAMRVVCWNCMWGEWYARRARVWMKRAKMQIAKHSPRHREFIIRRFSSARTHTHTHTGYSGPNYVWLKDIDGNFFHARGSFIPSTFLVYHAAATEPTSLLSARQSINKKSELVGRRWLYE
jgi:hypothetical protein